MSEYKKEFICPNCGWSSSLDMNIDEPDHCPNCLAAIHKEDTEGYECGGMLEAVGIWVKSDDEWYIIQLAPVTERDSRIKILSIASKPLSSPPFPVDRLEELTKMMGGRGKIKI